jgi:flagellar motor switch protein FliG
MVSPAPATVSELTGLRKAAVLLVSLGRDRSARILSQLRESEVELLTAEIARLDTVPSEVTQEVIGEFAQLVAARAYASKGGLAYAQELLESTLGRERASEIVAKLTAALMQMPFEFLRQADPRQLLSFLQDEHPQTIALVLAHMSSTEAAVVLSGLSPELQADVAHRIAIMDRTSPDVVQQVEAVLERKLSSVMQPADLSAVGGLPALVEVINHADRGTERQILEGLEARDPALAELVRSQMFVFEDITTLDDRSVQLVLRQVETSDLATALKGVRVDVRDKVIRNMSERAGEALGEEIELLGPVRLKAVEEAQAKVVHAIRTLEEAGQLVISRGADDEFVA